MVKFSDRWNASKWVICAGAILVVLQFLAYIGLNLVGSIPFVVILTAVPALVIWAISLVVFFPLFAYLSYHCAKKFNATSVDTAVTVAFAAAVLGGLSILFDTIRYVLLGLGGIGVSSVLNSKGPTSNTLALTGLGLAGQIGICSIGFVLGSIAVNFMLGFVGGMIFEAKKRPVLPS